MIEKMVLKPGEKVLLLHHKSEQDLRVESRWMNEQGMEQMVRYGIEDPALVASLAATIEEVLKPADFYAGVVEELKHAQAAGKQITETLAEIKLQGWMMNPDGTTIEKVATPCPRCSCK